ncbi:MAG: SPOR domain-containing protein [Chitinispirillia bacterium]|nr:SPOR domain-containing protein [Chitinispirillia bacterium]
MTAAAALLAVTLSAVAPVTAAPPLSPEISAALTMPLADALRIADSLARAQNTPPAVKAQSNKVLGDYRFAREDYKGAAEFYRQATTLDTAAIYRELYDVSMHMASAPAQTRVPAPQNVPGPASQPATVSTPQTAPVSTPPQPAPASPPQNVYESASKNTQGMIPQSFTVQVGAFGSKVNADNLAKKLTAYSGVNVSTATSGGGQTVYRVRVGAFDKREDAEALAVKLNRETGLAAKVLITGQ